MTPRINLCKSYSNELTERKIQISEERWKHVLVFRRYLANQVGLQRSTMQHKLRRLSDSFFRHESKRYITLPNLIISLRENDLKLPPSIVHLVYKAFDEFQNNEFDWRKFVFMLHVTCRDINEEVKNLMKLAYRFYVGLVIDLNEPCNSNIKFQDVGKVFGMILHPNKVQSILYQFDEAWSYNEALLRIDKAGKEMATSFLSYESFEKVLDKIIEPNTVNDDTTMKDSFEQEYFPYTLYKYRRCMRYMVNFVTLSSMKFKSRCLLEWKRVSQLRRRMRLFFCKYIERREHLLMSIAYSCLWQQTIMQNAAISIQRIIRTHLANVTTLHLKKERDSIILIQTSIRCFIAKCIVYHLRKERAHAAVTIQRCIRGTIGRHLARNRLLTAIDIQHLYALQQKEIHYQHNVIKHAKIIQSMYRSKIAARKFKLAVEKKAREQVVASAIRSLQLKEEEEDKIYKEQLKMHARVSLEQYKKERYNEARVAAAKEEVRQLHIRMLDKERYDKQRKEYRLESESRAKSIVSFANDWTEKESEACEDLEKKCLHCLYTPDTPFERKEGKRIRQMIKKRVANVLQRADSRQAQMEFDEARVIAEREVIQLMINEKRSEYKSNIEKAKVELELHLDRKMNNEKTLKENQNVASAAWRISSAARLWLAKRELKRRCFQTYEKIYCEIYHAFYYRNSKTGEVSWEKPILLRNLDLPAENDLEYIYTSSINDGNFLA